MGLATVVCSYIIVPVVINIAFNFLVKFSVYRGVTSSVINKVKNIASKNLIIVVPHIIAAVFTLKERVYFFNINI